MHESHLLIFNVLKDQCTGKEEFVLKTYWFYGCKKESETSKT